MRGKGTQYATPSKSGREWPFVSGPFFVYILASHIGGTLYVGVTNDLVRRISEHRSGLVPGFTNKHRVAQLVYFEEFGDADSAIAREKQLKGWNRAWKIKLIEKANPEWRDLCDQIGA